MSKEAGKLKNYNAVSAELLALKKEFEANVTALRDLQDRVNDEQARLLKLGEELKNAERDAVCEEIARIDVKLWESFISTPSDATFDMIEQNAAPFLKGDLVYLLCSPELDWDCVWEKYNNLISDSPFKSQIEKHINLDSVLEEVVIRRDFATALKNVRDVSALSWKLGYGFNTIDIKNLAELHRSGKFRKKIEDLLTDCNFHYEAGKFAAHEYDEFLKEMPNAPFESEKEQDGVEAEI